LVDVVNPDLSRADIYRNLARSFSWDARKWRSQAVFNPWIAERLTQGIQAALDKYAGSYDMIVQLGTLCAPGIEPRVPYVIYADNTMAITRRLYPHPLSPQSVHIRMTYEARIFRHAPAIFTTSEHARASIVDDYGCSPDRVVAVGEGANQKVSELGLKDYSVPKVIFVGMNFRRKGGDVLFQAWPGIREQVPAAELIIVGPSRRRWRRLPPGVHWAGRVDRSRLSALYQSASIFVLPSLFDPSPLVLLEAMGHGLPCVSTTTCAIPELVQDGVTGVLVPPGDAAALTSALVALLTESDRTAAMGRAAHMHVVQGMSWSDVATRIAAQLPVGPGTAGEPSESA
jgi:glycosyltransferase involved in cell wall biosynthesis